MNSCPDIDIAYAVVISVLFALILWLGFSDPVDRDYWEHDERPGKGEPEDSLPFDLTGHPGLIGEAGWDGDHRTSFEQHMRDEFKCTDKHFVREDDGYHDGSVDNHWRTWLAAWGRRS